MNWHIYWAFPARRKLTSTLIRSVPVRKREVSVSADTFQCWDTYLSMPAD